MMSADEVRTEQRSSVKISTTAAGKPLPEVKVYEDTTAEELDRMRVEAVRTYRETAAGLFGLSL
jgi:hypothetical protein